MNKSINQSHKQYEPQQLTRNSSGDEIANVNFLTDDIVHVQPLDNTTDTDRRRYVLGHRCTKVSEIMQCNGHYAVQGDSRSPILVNQKLIYDFPLVIILTYFLSYTVSELWLIIGQIFACKRRVPHFNALAGVTSANIAINNILLKTRFFGLHFRCGKYLCIFNHFYVIRPKATEFGEIIRPLGLLCRSRLSKVTKLGTNRKLICDFLSVINTNLAPILHRFRDIAFNRSKIAIFGYTSSV